MAATRRRCRRGRRSQGRPRGGEDVERRRDGRGLPARLRRRPRARRDHRASRRTARRSRRTGTSVTLELNGRAVRDEAGEPRRERGRDGRFRGRPRCRRARRRAWSGAAEDALPRDNSFFFAISRGQALSRARDRRTERAARRAVCTCERALAIGDQPNFRVTTKRLGTVTSSDLVGRSLVLLNDSDLPGGELGRRLVEYVQNGGGLARRAGRSECAARPAGVRGGAAAPRRPTRPIDRSRGSRRHARLH